VVADLQRVVVDEARVALQPVRLRPLLDGVDTKPTKRSRSRAPGPSRPRRRPQRAAVHAEAPGLAMPCAASAAAISSLLGMQPTRAQVVP
jgi:hypothetical protein